jgi:hypothetical protein
MVTVKTGYNPGPKLSLAQRAQCALDGTTLYSLIFVILAPQNDEPMILYNLCLDNPPLHGTFLAPALYV